MGPGDPLRRLDADQAGPEMRRFHIQQRNRQDIDDILLHVGFIDHRMAQQEAVREDDGAAGVLGGAVPRPDFEDRRGEEILVDHVAPRDERTKSVMVSMARLAASLGPHGVATMRSLPLLS